MEFGPLHFADYNTLLTEQEMQHIPVGNLAGFAAGANPVGLCHAVLVTRGPQVPGNILLQKEPRSWKWV